MKTIVEVDQSNLANLIQYCLATVYRSLNSVSPSTSTSCTQHLTSTYKPFILKQEGTHNIIVLEFMKVSKFQLHVQCMYEMMY